MATFIKLKMNDLPNIPPLLRGPIMNPHDALRMYEPPMSMYPLTMPRKGYDILPKSEDECEAPLTGEPPFECQECNKTFLIPARYQRHLRVHTGERPFSCEFCGKCFSVKENLNVHRRIHTKERPYQCSICERGFEHSGKLHRHMRTHTGERPHKCHICDKTFVQSGQLVIHLRAHTGEKPYECHYCSKGFTCSKQLKVHIRTHTGEKPYRCDICGKTFGYNHVLKMHKNSHMGERLYKCTLCDDIFSSRKSLDVHIKDHSEGSISKSYNTESHNTLNITQDNLNHREDNGGNELRAENRLNMSKVTSMATDIQSPPAASLPSYSTSRFADIPTNAPSFPTDNRRNSGLPLTPPRSPELSPFSLSPETKTKDLLGNVIFQNYNKLNSHPDLSDLCYFTTINGERLACPAKYLIRLGPAPTPPPLTPDSGLGSEEEKDINPEEEFNASVVRVLKSCVGIDRFKKLGYPEVSIDDVIIKVVKMMNSEPCMEQSLTVQDRIKVNLRLLLEVCVPDPESWEKFGWKGKSIECIISEFLSYC